MRHFLLFSLCRCFCAAQSFSVGAIGGGRPTADITPASQGESRFYVVGLTTEFDLNRSFGLEVDALYHRHGFTGEGGSLIGGQIVNERGNTWEFPLLAKYKLPIRSVRPFVVAGISPRVMTGTIQSFSNVYGPSGPLG
jgi:hypothetical protein